VVERREATGEVERLFLHHSSLLRGFVLGLLPDLHRAEDVLQEVFLTLSRKAQDFRPGTNFLAWARATARLKVMEQYQRDRTSPRPLKAEVVEALVAAADEIDETAASAKRAIGLCLKKVAERPREILELRYDRGLLPAEIASRISWTVEAVHVALARARKFLRECAQRSLSAGGA